MMPTKKEIENAVKLLTDSGYIFNRIDPNKIFLVRTKDYKKDYKYMVRTTFMGSMARKFHRKDEEVAVINLKNLKWQLIKGNYEKKNTQ